MALSLRYLAATLGDLGDLSRSLALKERALAIAERNFGANHHVTAMYLHRSGLPSCARATYAIARLHFQTGLEHLRSAIRLWHEYVATALSVLARADASLGDFANARREQARAVTIYERVGGPNHPFVAIALTELANGVPRTGLADPGASLLERALAIREKNSAQPSRRRPNACGHGVHADADRPDDARASSSPAARSQIWERLDTPDAPEYATVLALYARSRRIAATVRGDGPLRESAGDSGRVFGHDESGVRRGSSGARGWRSPTCGDASRALSTAAKRRSTGREHLR